MGKIFSHYDNDLDRAWYESSNIKYSECDDKEGEMKTVRITFKDGRTYQYTNVPVQDYLRFRDHSSQGAAFAMFIKQHDTERIDNRSIEDIENELEKLRSDDYSISFDVENKKLSISFKGKTILEKETELVDNFEVKNLITDVLSALNINFVIN